MGAIEDQIREVEGMHWEHELAIIAPLHSEIGVRHELRKQLFEDHLKALHQYEKEASSE